MNASSPVNTIEKVRELALSSETFAYLVVDYRGSLVDKGGDLTFLEMPDWQIGTNILDTALFLVGHFPMTTEYESILSYQLGDSCVIDIHLFSDQGSLLIVLIDKTREMRGESYRRQHRNEQKLRRRYDPERAR